MELLDAFKALPSAVDDGEFAALPIPGRASDYLARGSAGAPIFLIRDVSAPRYSPGASLKHVSVQFHATCRVRTPAELVEGQFAVIACDASAPELYGLFVQCLGASIEQLPTAPTTSEIETRVWQLLDLFRAMNAPTGREIAGLWAELFVISKADDVEAAVAAWHSDAYERFDFSWAGGVLEVKATQGVTRAHEFALEQLEPPTGAGFVASILLQPLVSGEGVMDLTGRIDARLKNSADMRQKLWKNVASALGSDFGEKLDKRFEVSFAEKHCLVFSMADVPAPARLADPRISSVRFKVDLGATQSSVNASPLKFLASVFAAPKKRVP